MACVRMSINKTLGSDWCCDYSCSDTRAICDCHQTNNTLTKQYWWEGIFSDVVKWCCSCLTCTAYQGFGHRKPSHLKTLSVGFPFECEGVDMYLRHICEQLYGVIIIWFFAEYFTKWAEAYAVEEQTSEVIARLLVVCMSVKLLSN